jgi:hypothetical protein
LGVKIGINETIESHRRCSRCNHTHHKRQALLPRDRLLLADNQSHYQGKRQGEDRMRESN